MAESQKKSSSTVNSTGKNSFLDLDIDKDFLTSWKSESVADEEMDFDLMPVSKGKKNSFNFDKVDMDFNLDGDFGKIPSFNMDMPGLDISSPAEKDGKRKDNSKKLSSRNDKGKANQFNFGFDFDDFGNFDFEPIPTKGCSEVQTDKDNIEISPSGSGCQDIEGSSHVKLTVDMTLTEDVPGKPSLHGTLTTFDMKYQGGGSADLEPTVNICPPELAMDDSVTSKYSTVTDEFSSDKKMTHPEKPITSEELPAIHQSEKSLSLEPVDPEACTENVAVQDLSSDSLANYEPIGVNSLEELDKVDCVDKTATGSIEEQDVNVTTIAGSICDDKHAMSGNSQFFQTVAISEKNDSENSQRGIEIHGLEDKMTDLGQVISSVDNSSITSVVSGKISDASTEKENQEPASKIIELTSVSEPAAKLLVEKEIEIGREVREPSVSSPKSFIQSEKPQCHVPKASSTQTTLSSLSSKNKGFTQPSLVEKRRDWDSVQSDRKIASFSLEDSKTPFRRELPQTWSQESFKGPEPGEVSNADSVQNTKKLNDSSTTKNLDMVKEKSPLKQRETSMKDLNILSSGTTVPSLSVEIKKRTAESSKSSITLACPLTSKRSPVREKLSAVGGRKTTDLCGLKLSSLSLDSMKSPTQKDMKSVGNIGQIRAVKTPLDVTHFADSKKKTPSTISMKRKTVEGFNADIAVLNPSKRVSLSPIQNRKFVETSMPFSDKKASNPDNLEDDCTKSTLYSRQLSIVGPEMSFSIENYSHIKQAEAYSKELDDIDNMMRKKHEEAKELLVRAVVNSNKLLMLKHPLLQLEEKIRATQNSFAKLSLNSNCA